MENTSQNVIKIIVEQEKMANDFGFSWENIEQILDQIKSECEEIKAAWIKNDRNNLEEEIGDLINAALSLTMFCNFDPFQLIDKNNKKFQKRFNMVMDLAKKDGLDNLKGQPVSVLLSYWEKAKKLLV